MRRRGFVLASVLGRDTRSVLLVLLVVSIAVSAAVASSKAPATTAAGIPSCASLSRTAIASLAGTGPLTLRNVVGPYCTFTGQIFGHYKPTLQVGIIPYVKSLWLGLTTRPAAPGSASGHANAKLFFAQGTVTERGHVR